jgi:hypothetical protein
MSLRRSSRETSDWSMPSSSGECRLGEANFMRERAPGARRVDR